MDRDASAAWPSMLQGASDDFSSFLDFADLDVDFSGLDPCSNLGATSSAPPGSLEQATAAHELPTLSTAPSLEDLGGNNGSAFVTGDAATLPDAHVVQGNATAALPDQQHLNAPLNDPRLNLADPQLLAQMHRLFQQQQQNQRQQRLHQHHRQQQQQQQQRPSTQHLQTNQSRQMDPTYAANSAYFGTSRVPPTPNSMEMQPNGPVSVAGLNPQQMQAMFEAYSRQQQEQMLFTPLVSPAVTPLDTELQLNEYPTATEFYTPLTSPALLAQNASTARQTISRHASQHFDLSATTSPVDITFDPSLRDELADAHPPKKSRRQTEPATASNIRTTPRAVRQSPAVRAQSRKRRESVVNNAPTSMPSAPAVSLTAAVNAALAGASPNVAAHGNALQVPLNGSRQASEAGSMSPESPSEMAMPPPNSGRKRGSLGASPSMMTSSSPSNAGSRQSNVPATPASLMQISKSDASSTARTPSRGASIEGVDRRMKDFSLPAPAVDAQQASGQRVLGSTQSSLHQQATSVIQPKAASASSTPMAPRPITSRAASSSIQPSPHPKSKSQSGTILPKSDQKGVSRTKKRNSSSHVSPALRPRISPSIKPLLPEGATLSADTSALLLATKSNYQNIIEGNHLPGVSYPEALSENLTSKRTSHKLAEQGRRNRINNALQEMSALLPAHIRNPSVSGTGSGREDGDATPGDTSTTTGTGKEANGVAMAKGPSKDGGMTGKDAQNSGATGQNASMSSAAAQNAQASSKASTVEMAIDYIRSLQADLRDQKELEAQLRDVQARLAIAEQKLQAATQAQGSRSASDIPAADSSPTTATAEASS